MLTGTNEWIGTYVDLPQLNEWIGTCVDLPQFWMIEWVGTCVDSPQWILIRRGMNKLNR